MSYRQEIVSGYFLLATLYIVHFIYFILMKIACVVAVDNQIENAWNLPMPCWMKYLIRLTSHLM